MAEPRRTAAEDKAAAEKAMADKAAADRAELEKEYAAKFEAAKAELEAGYAAKFAELSASEVDEKSNEGVKRTVKVGLMTYTDTAGGIRTAKVGEVIEVHPDKVERFDRFNRLQ